MKLELSKGFIQKLKGRVEAYEFELGILQDKPHKEPVHSIMGQEPALGSYAGGAVRKTSRINSGKSVGEVLTENMRRLGINLLQAPFKDANNSEIVKFMGAYLKAITTKSRSIKRVENLLQAVVRNPILRLDYGNNKGRTADAKGFDRHLFDTGQMFKAIRAKAKRKGK